MKNKTEAQWQREEDAYTLSRAAEIQQSPSRMRGAKQAAAKMLKEQQDKLKGLQAVVKKKPTKRTATTTNRTQRSRKK